MIFFPVLKFSKIQSTTSRSIQYEKSSSSVPGGGASDLITRPLLESEPSIVSRDLFLRSPVPPNSGRCLASYSPTWLYFQQCFCQFGYISCFRLICHRHYFLVTREYTRRSRRDRCPPPAPEDAILASLWDEHDPDTVWRHRCSFRSPSGHFQRQPNGLDTTFLIYIWYVCFYIMVRCLIFLCASRIIFPFQKQHCSDRVWCSFDIMISFLHLMIFLCDELSLCISLCMISYFLPCRCVILFAIKSSNLDFGVRSKPCHQMMMCFSLYLNHFFLMFWCFKWR